MMEIVFIDGNKMLDSKFVISAPAHSVDPIPITPSPCSSSFNAVSGSRPL